MSIEITLLKQVCIFANLWGNPSDKSKAITVTVNGREILLDPKNSNGIIELAYSNRLEGKRTYPVDLMKLHVANEYVHRWDGEGYIQRWLTDHLGDLEDCDSHLDIRFAYLMILKKSCKEVCDDHGKASELLPNDDGDYDEDYFKSVAKTYERLCGLGECPPIDTAYFITIER